MDILDAAQDGAFYANAGVAAGLSASDAKAAMGELCPLFATALRRRAEDPAAFGALLDLLEDGEQDAFLDDPAAIADPEALEDGDAILADLYDSKAKGLAVAKAHVGGIADGPLEKIAAISAASVLAVLAQSNRPQQLAGSGQSSGGSGFWGTLATALVEGVMKGAAKSLAPKPRRRRYASYTTTRRRKTPRKRTRTPSLDDIFGQILGTRRR
jgi:hypothetical protein